MKITQVFRLLPLSAAALAACATAGPKHIAPHFTPPRTVAVLPLANQSLNVNAPVVVREAFETQLAQKGYNLLPADQVDAILKEKFSVSDGGQLGGVQPAKLAEALNADGLVYGEVVDYKMTNLGVYQQKVVAVSFKMLDGQGQTLWEVEKKATDRNLATDAKGAKEAFATGVAEQAAGNILEGSAKGSKARKLAAAVGFKGPLGELTRKAVRWSIATLPGPRSSDGGKTETQTRSTSYSHHESTTTEEE